MLDRLTSLLPFVLTSALGLVGCIGGDPPACLSDSDCAPAGRCVAQACVALEPDAGDDGGGASGGGGAPDGAPGDTADAAPDATAPSDATAADAGPCVAEAERCDGLDNDCDGRADEDFEGVGEVCSEGVGDCFQAGGVVCAVSGDDTVCTAKMGLPGAELCDGRDNDCDQAVDERLSQPCYGGPRGTAGVGECLEGARACIFGEPGACEGEVRPTDEICDGLDNDCDGLTDEGAGTGATCFDGPPDALEAPATACRAGALACEDGAPGACVGAVLPAETDGCNGVNDDCDEAIDEDCTCEAGLPCAGSIVGACTPGVQRCDEDAPVVCEGRVDPQPETCDGTDEDCDRRTDEGADAACYEGPEPTRGVGRCRAGVRRCQDGALEATCVGAVLPTDEICNALDDDCDGAVDEGFDGLGEACAAGVGACRAVGVVTCSDGAGVCDAVATPPGQERCNGVDDDCDGDTDEGAPTSCYPLDDATAGVGTCRAGGRACVEGVLGPCEGAVVPRPEVCGTGADEDCDGTVDEGCGCPEGDTRACGSDVGACAVGMQTCQQGAWGACLGGTGPSEERCNGADDDCDGDTDEGADGEPCYDGPGGTVGVGLCRGGTARCDQGQTVCEGEVVPRGELCDGTDRDCDGEVDEADPRVDAECVADRPGACAPGRLSCVGGAVQCVSEVAPRSETCDGTDEDCDGLTDEALGQQDCDADALGVCAAGALRCVDGAPLCEPGAPSAETCDRVDEDCDGAVDEAIDATPCAVEGLGECARGLTACVDGRKVCTAPAPRPDVCESGRDEDCDGMSDEGPRVAGVAAQVGTSSPSRDLWVGESAAGFMVTARDATGRLQAVLLNPRGLQPVANNSFGCGDTGQARVLPTADGDGFAAVCNDDGEALEVEFLDDRLRRAGDRAGLDERHSFDILVGFDAQSTMEGIRSLATVRDDGERLVVLVYSGEDDWLTIGNSTAPPALAANPSGDLLGAAWIENGLGAQTIKFQEVSPVWSPRAPCCAIDLAEVPVEASPRLLGAASHAGRWTIWWVQGEGADAALQVVTAGVPGVRAIDLAIDLPNDPVTRLVGAVHGDELTFAWRVEVSDAPPRIERLVVGPDFAPVSRTVVSNAVDGIDGVGVVGGPLGTLWYDRPAVSAVQQVTLADCEGAR